MLNHQLRDDSGFTNDNRVNLPPKHDRQIFRRAFIHSAAILFVIVCGACAILVYRILEPFLHCSLWSIFAGAFLFPLKNYVTSIARYHLHQFDRSSHLLIYGLVIVLPLKILDKTIESIGPLCIRKWKEFLLISILLPLIEFLQSGIVYRSRIILEYNYLILFESIVHFFDSPWVISVVIIYLFAILTVYNSSLLIKNILKIFSIPIWFILFIYLSQFLSIHYRLAVIFVLFILTLVGCVVTQSDPSNVNHHRNSIYTNLLNIIKQIRVYYHSKSPLPIIPSSSTPYFTFLLWSFVAIKLHEFYWYLIPISLFVIIYKIIKSFLYHTYTYIARQAYIKYTTHKIIIFLRIRRDVFTLSPLYHITRFLIKGDKKLNHALQHSIDYLVTACIILLLFFIIIFGTILLLIQIHHESLHMIKLTSNFVNNTILFQHMLPDKEHMTHFMDTIINKFYVSGRSWITKQVAKVQPPRVEPICCLPLSGIPNDSPYMQINIFGQDSLSNKKLEEEVLQIWDRLHTYMTNTSTYKNRSKIINSSTNQPFVLINLLTYIQTNFDLHFNDFYRLIRDNLDVLRTILDSIRLNTTLVLTLLSTIISLLFTGGFAIFNFFVSVIVSITLLFYVLLNSDQPIYQPTVWFNNILAIGGQSLGKAVNDVVTSVFITSFKIATFYGLYTYVLHTLLGSNLVFLPAVISLVFAVILKSYWAALPGCLDLWLVQQRPFSALLLLLAQITPVYFVDTAIYSEVKGGGHQYLTALAITGGVYYRGIEGALIGPIILCCLLVGVRMYNETIATTLLTD